MCTLKRWPKKSSTEVHIFLFAQQWKVSALHWAVPFQENVSLCAFENRKHLCETIHISFLRGLAIRVLVVEYKLGNFLLIYTLLSLSRVSISDECHAHEVGNHSFVPTQKQAFTISIPHVAFWSFKTRVLISTHLILFFWDGSLSAFPILQQWLRDINQVSHRM